MPDSWRLVTILGLRPETRQVEQTVVTDSPVGPATPTGSVDLTPPPKPPKDLSIQALRGLAVILMVAGHVIGSSASRGLQVSDDSWWRYYFLAFEDIRMPLFTVISGYVYGMRPMLARAGYPQMVSGKAQRLLWPLLTVGTLLFATKVVSPGTNVPAEPSDFWRTFVYGYEHLWFLQAIFIIFLVTGVLDFLGYLATKRRWAASVAVAMVLFVLLRVPPELNIFSVNGALRLMPFFLLGYGMCRYRVLDLRGRRWLGWIGGFSFAIYLLHVFGSAGARILLGRAGIDGHVAVFVISMVIAVGAPIAFQLVSRRSRTIQHYVLGEKVPSRQRG